MYESEANHRLEADRQLPPEALAAFAELGGKIRLRTVLPWSEHCTECVWPTCYSTCDLYAPRPDGKCRRFADGMVRIASPLAPNSYLLKIRFKRWGKLETPGNVYLHTAEGAKRIENRDYALARALQWLPLPQMVQIGASSKRYSFKKKMAVRPANQLGLPDHFLLECYNPAAEAVDLTLTMRASEEGSKMPFQKRLRLTPGFHRIRIPLAEIAALVNLQNPFLIDLTPNDEENETTLYFGLMDFVTETPAERSSSEAKEHPDKQDRKIKCVVWDLDHTLWEGVLVEDGPGGVRLKDGIVAVIEDLDRRGILQSVASKNSPEDAAQALRKFKLDEYFLCPQISWQPKSQGLQAIRQQLNLGMDSILFVDDSEFERQEVQGACPEIRTLDSLHYRTVPEREDCQVPVTAESRERRKLYQVEASRQHLAQSFSHDYMAFLRHCQIQLTVRPLSEENLQRVHELTQRTNQMNFSGSRYDREVLRGILSNQHLDTFVLSCQDRFGSYGVIGFSIVDSREPRMTDLMFSCRVQSKRVEHAFLSWVMRHYIEQTGRDFHANYRKTPRNAMSGQVFADLEMEETETREGVLSLRFPRHKPVPDDGVIAVSGLEMPAGRPA
jgi:FkbH-like protein